MISQWFAHFWHSTSRVTNSNVRNASKSNASPSPGSPARGAASVSYTHLTLPTN